MNAGYAKRRHSDAALERLVDRLMDLDRVDDVGSLFDAIEGHENKNKGVS
jgi:hypothetical protein